MIDEFCLLAVSRLRDSAGVLSRDGHLPQKGRRCRAGDLPALRQPAVGLQRHSQDTRRPGPLLQTRQGRCRDRLRCVAEDLLALHNIVAS